MVGRFLSQLVADPVRRARVLLALAALLALGLIVTSTPLAEAVAKVEALTADEAKPKIPWELDVAVGIQLAARLNLVLLGLLMATAGVWCRAWESPPQGLALPVRPPLPGWLVPAVFGLVVLGTALRLPLAQKSLWWDELWVIRQCSHGQWKEDPEAATPGALKFSPTSWKRCAFYYQKPTNHVPMSLLQKASLTLVQPLLGQPTGAFSELVARLPALALSAVSMALVAALLAAWGVPAGGVVVGALLLALHPMAIRYGVDARGYALVLPLALSALLAGTRLVRLAGRDTLGWVWLALNQCLWLWAFPHGLLDVLVMTLLLALLLWRAQNPGRDRLTVLLRLGVVHLLAGILFVQLFLPNLLQARRWVGQENQGHQLDAVILKDTVSQVLTGLRWREPGAGTDLAAGLWDLSSSFGGPAVGAAFLALLMGGLLVSVVKGLGRGGRSGWLLIGLLSSGVLFAAVAYGLGLYYYSRFAIALVPAVVVGVTVGWADAGSWWGRLQRALLALLAGVCLTGVGVLLQRPIEPIREVAAFLKEAAGENGRVLAYGHGREAVMVYLPTAVPVEDDEQITAAERAAQAGGQKLLLAIGHIHFNRTLIPKGFAVFEDPTRFTEVARFDGLGIEHHYRIYEAVQPKEKTAPAERGGL
jgi:hypothetical protein